MIWIEAPLTADLLLQQEEPGWGRLLFFLIFFLVWAISAIFNALNKRAKQQQQPQEEWDVEEVVVTQPQPIPPRTPRPVERRDERPIPPPLPHRTPAADVPIEGPRSFPTASRQPRPAPIPRRSFPTPAQVRKPVRTFPLPPPRVPTTEVVVHALPEMRDEIGATVIHPRSAGADATQLRQWLRPGNLRSHFILTELLRPPLALREGSHERI